MENKKTLYNETARGVHAIAVEFGTIASAIIYRNKMQAAGYTFETSFPSAYERTNGGRVYVVTAYKKIA